MSDPSTITNDTVNKSYEVLAILAVCEAACDVVRKDHIGEDVGHIGLAIRTARRMAGEVHDVVETNAEVTRRPPASSFPTDPIFTAFARMDALSEAMDTAADRDGYNAPTNPLLKAWEEAAMEAASTAPTTRAGLVTLLERLAADIDKGVSCWQQQAALTAGAAVGALMQGGVHG